MEAINWTDLAKHFNDNDFPPVLSKKDPPVLSKKDSLLLSHTHARPNHVLRGSKTNETVAAVPRRITAFISRLHIDTTEDDLVNLMSRAGMKEPKCQKIIPKETMKFKTSAFMVSCSILSEKIFYNELNWPAGCELRDWYFKNKNKNGLNMKNVADK